jgi:hypothetical protein
LINQTLVKNVKNDNSLLFANLILANFQKFRQLTLKNSDKTIFDVIEKPISCADFGDSELKSRWCQLREF